MIDHKKLILELGGAHKLHSALSSRGHTLKAVTVRSWTLDGRSIPARYWLEVKEIASQQGVSVTLDHLAQFLVEPSTQQVAS